MRDIGAFRSEAFNVFLFLLEKRFRDKEREVGVLMSGVFNHLVQWSLDIFPERVTVGTDNHASLDRRVIREFGLQNGIGIPLGTVGIFALLFFQCSFLLRVQFA